nr:(-)-alpha-terpineol synthase-like [Ipomoea batatas]GME16539.1 (-)-alpha-terpineol synthase-like [Ipomoea batatas]
MSPQIVESERRCGNYIPKVWTDDFIQSLTSVYLDQKYLEQAAKLKESVRGMLETTVTKPLEQLELIDALQRLGLSRHFTHEINNILASMHAMITSNDKPIPMDDSLYETALQFRLLRQEGFQIAQEMFNGFMSEEGSFDVKHCGEIKGLLSLYEASYLSMEDEDVLEKAKDFSIHHLKQALKQGAIDEKLGEQVSHALEMPFHWMMQRLESRWFIDVYEKTENNNCIVLELAKLDYNMVQVLHLDELKQLSRWHENVNLAEKMEFARNRLAEGFLWSVGLAYEPEFEYCRKISTKSAEIITVIDDVYDVYATFNEVEILTDAVNRWDVSAIEGLPNYIKICFLAMFNYVNEVVYDILQQQDFNVLPYIQKVWSDLCRTYLVEAKWFNEGLKPKLKEFLENAVVSIAGPLLLVQAYISTAKPINKEHLDQLLRNDHPIHFPSLISRLTDDLATSKDELERGDIPKSIQCYMQEKGCSEEDARNYMHKVVETTWKKMNKHFILTDDSNLPKDYKRMALNHARISQCMYQYGDGYGRPDGITKDRINSLFFQPIPLHPTPLL